MELKNALTVCLISLFSATLVVLIARSLDSQAAARLEPQLARIAAELEALRSAAVSPPHPLHAPRHATARRPDRLLLPRQPTLPHVPGHQSAVL